MKHSLYAINTYYRETWNNAPTPMIRMSSGLFDTPFSVRRGDLGKIKADGKKQIMHFDNSCLVGDKLVTNRSNVLMR